MTLLSPNHNYAADECIAQIPQHHIPTPEEKVKASENFDKSVLVAAHMAALHDAYIMEMATHPVNEVTIKPSSPTSSVAGLKPSTLKQLKIGKVHRKRVLHGTLCVKTLCTKTSHDSTMIVNVFEDDEGKASPIYLINAMEGNGGSAQAQQMFPQGSKIAVKEPYLTRWPDGEVVLLVEKTTDLVFLWVPDHVEENGKANGGNDVQENGINGRVSGGRDSFATEKEDVEIDGRVKVSDDGVTLVAEKERESSSASRELKFDDIIAMKGAKDEGDAEEVTRELISDDIVAMHCEGEEAGVEVAKQDAVKGIDGIGGVEGLEKDAPGNEGVAVNVGKEEGKGVGAVSYEVGNVGNEGDGKEEGNIGEQEGPEKDAPRNGGVAVNVGKEEGKGVGAVSDEVGNVENEGDGKDVGNIGEQEGDGGLEDKAGELMAKMSRTVDVDVWETAATLRAEGNTLLARGEPNQAASMYTRAVEKAQAADDQKVEEVLSLSNRAEVWLRLCRNQAALQDANAALRILQDHDVKVDAGELAMAKALFRKGRALMGLHKYEEAMRVLQEVLGKAPQDRQLREAAVKCRDRLKHVLKPGKRQRAAANRRKSNATAIHNQQ